MDNLTLYKSSAGSGKTTVLSREYLKLAIKRNFRSILAVTFTNKATNELKERVIKKLSAYVNNPPDAESEELRLELGLGVDDFRENCRNVLAQILNNYGAFSISTIDAFFQKIIRSFARESGIQGNFKLEINHDQILEEAISRLFMEAGKNETLTKWLIRFSHEIVDNAEGSDLTNKVRSLGKEVFQEEFKVIQDIVAKEGSIERFEKLETELFRITKKFSAELSRSGKNIIEMFESKGIPISELTTGVDSQILALSKGEEPDWTKSRLRDALANSEKFSFGNNPRKEEIVAVANSGAQDELLRIKKYAEENQELFYTAKVILENLYTFGIISDLIRKIDDYKFENDIMLLSDSSLFLAQIIQGYDSPFIYEKVGSRYRHFLLDEFQDTSKFQWNNFKPLLENSLAEGQKSVVVGDVKQSIYRWRGGDWNLLSSRVSEQLPNSEVKNLLTNWRSNAKVVDFNNAFFQDAIREMASMYANKAGNEVTGDRVNVMTEKFAELYHDVKQEVPKFKNKDDGYVEVDFYEGKDNREFQEYGLNKTIEIVERLQEKGLKARDIAVLVRTRLEGEKVSSALIKHSKSSNAKSNINYDVVSSEILRVANSPSVNLIVAVMKWMNRPEERIPLVSFISDYQVYFNEMKMSLVEVFEKIYANSLTELLPEGFEQDLPYISKLQLYELSEEIIRRFNLKDRKQEWPYLLGFQDELMQFTSREAGDLNSFLAWWDIKGADLPVNISEEIDAIKIMTIHKAKGLQFEAVILPFCSWKIEPDGTKQRIIWASADQAPFDMFSVYPLKYSKSLAKSFFSNDYLLEKFSNYVDNMNLLYVAFTRAIQGLYAIVPSNKEESIGALITTTLQKGIEHDVLKFGEEKFELKKNSDQGSKSMELKSFHSSRWSDRVTIATKELIKLKEDVYEKVERGVVMHDILSELTSKDQLDTLVNNYIIRGKIQSEQKEILMKELSDILGREKISDWFGGRVINEGVILGAKGVIRRPDKVVIKEDKVLVIDFKTGEERPEHEKQVKEYMDLLSEIYKKRVEGIVCYLQPFSLKEVN